MTRTVVPGRLGAVTGGAPAFPLAVLFGLNFVDEIDRLAFATLSPEIREAFGLSATGIGAIGSIVSVFILLAAVPLGYLADRVNRVWLVAGAALLWGTMSALTGLVATVALLFAVRLLAGLGRVSNEVVHASLLTDYYPPRVHPGSSSSTGWPTRSARSPRSSPGPSPRPTTGAWRSSCCRSRRSCCSAWPYGSASPDAPARTRPGATGAGCRSPSPPGCCCGSGRCGGCGCRRCCREWRWSRCRRCCRCSSTTSSRSGRRSGARR
nr:hypothetical protein GCM10020093_003230 [Planobispora longispora]